MKLCWSLFAFGLGIPYDISLYWHPRPVGITFCKVRALLTEMFTYSSASTAVAFALERYLAISRPFIICRMSDQKGAIKILAVLWGISLLAASPFFVLTKVNDLNYSCHVRNCFQSAPCNLPGGYMIELSFFIFFLIPNGALRIIYRSMKCALRNQGLAPEYLQSIARQTNCLMIVFLLCSLAFHGQRFLHAYGQDSLLNEWLHHILKIFYYLFPIVNPFLYNTSSSEYRLAFYRTLKCCKSTQTIECCI